MPAPHPLRSLAAGGPEGRSLAAAQLRAALAAHGGDVRATAAGLDPPVHETTLHDWIADWGLDDARRGRERTEPAAQRQGVALLVTSDRRTLPFYCDSMRRARVEIRAWLGRADGAEGEWTVLLDPATGALIERWSRREGRAEKSTDG